MPKDMMGAVRIECFLVTFKSPVIDVFKASITLPLSNLAQKIPPFMLIVVPVKIQELASYKYRG